MHTVVSQRGGHRCALALAGVVLAAGFTGRAGAQAADYLGDTHVYETAELGELEAEYWFDYGRRRDVARDFFRHTAAVEYGFTKRFMAEVRGQVEDEEGRSLRFQQAELETRYRFGEKGGGLVDWAVFAELEYEYERAEDEREWAVEPGVIVSRDFGRLNLTANAGLEVPFESGDVALRTALAAGYRFSGWLKAGFEYQHNWREDRIALIPQLWVIPRENLFIKLGYSFGVADEKESFLRAALELEF